MDILSIFRINKPKTEGQNPAPVFQEVGKPQELHSQKAVEPVRTSQWTYFQNGGFRNNQIEKTVTFEELRTLAKTTTEISTCINTLNSYLSRVKFDFRDRSSGKKNKKSRDIEKIFKKNRHLTFRKFQELICTETCITDALTIYPVRNLAGEIVRFRFLAGETIDLVVNDYQEIVGYQQRKNGVAYKDFTLNDLLYMPKNITANSLYGCSYVEQLAETAKLLNSKRNESKEYYENGNLPNTLIALPPKMAPNDVSDFEKYWNMTTKGISKSLAKFLPGGSAVHVTKEKVNEKDEQIERYQREVFSIFRLSPALFLKDSNRATAQVSNQIAEEVGMIDMLEWISEVINNLIEFYIGDDSVECFYVIDTVVDQEKEARINDIYVKNGILTINEVRETLGKEKLEAEEVEEVDNKDNSINDEMEKPKEKQKGFFSKLVTKSSEIDKFDKEISNNEDKIATLVLDYFLYQNKNILDLFNSGDSVNISTKKIDDAIELPQKDIEVFVNKVNEALDEIGLASIEKAFKLGQVEDAEAFEKIVLQAQKFTLDRSASLIGKKWVSGKLVENPKADLVITETTRTQVKSLVNKAVDEGWSNDELALKFQDSGIFTKERAETVARTETSNLENDLNLKSYNETGIEKKRWITARDGKVCEECLENEKQGAIGVNEKFANGVFAPPSHPNCRCAIAPVVE